MKRLNRYLVTLPIILAAMLVAQLLQPYFNETNVIMVYMLAVVVVAFRLGLGPAAMACPLGVFLYDFVNVQPYFQMTGSIYEYAFTLLVMLITVGIIAAQADKLRRKAAESAALYALSAELADLQSEADILECLERHLALAFRVKVLPADEKGPVDEVGQEPHVLPAGRGRAQMILPLQVEGGIRYQMVVSAGRRELGSRDRRDHLSAMVGQGVQALERISLRERVQEKEILIQKESLRNSILNTISHDLRTPLASIIGASSSLQSEAERISVQSSRRLHAIIHAEAVHMRHLVDNLLDMARLQGGNVRLACAWEALEEIASSAVATQRRRAKGREITVAVPPDLPLVRCDSMLIERVLINLLENAVKYSLPGSAVRLTACLQTDHLQVTVASRGKAIPTEEREKVFEPFYRIQPSTVDGGGLGLTICRGIISAHGGEIWITSADEGETLVHFTLPLTEIPELPREALASEVEG